MRAIYGRIGPQNYVIADITAVYVCIVFSDEDKILINDLYQLKGYKVKVTEVMSEFPNK